MFTAGVLDVLMEHGLYDFGSVWGVSPGSISASSFQEPPDRPHGPHHARV